MLKLVFALFVAMETASMEQKVQRLQEKNQEIKALAKQVMIASQSVSADLRSGNIERINAALQEYEHQLEQTQKTILSSMSVI